MYKALAKLYYQIKGCQPAGPNREAEWAQPPVLSSMVETDNLLSFPLLAGWCITSIATRHFACCAGLVSA